MKFIIAQILGFIGMGLYMVSFLLKTAKKITLLQCIACVFFSVHFILLGGFTGCVLNTLGIGRAVVCSVDKPWARSRYTMWGFILLFILAGILTWDGIMTVFPTVGMIAGCFGLFSRKPRPLRYFQLFGSSPCWLVYNWSVRSYSGVINEIANMIFVIVALCIYGWVHDRRPEKTSL